MDEQINESPAADAPDAADQPAADTPAAPPTSGDASAALSSDSASAAPNPGAPAAEDGAAPADDAARNDAPADDGIFPPGGPDAGNAQSAPHPSIDMLGNLHTFLGMAAHYESQGNLNVFVSTAREMIADIRATFGA